MRTDFRTRTLTYACQHYVSIFTRQVLSFSGSYIILLASLSLDVQCCLLSMVS
jgi:hypothetical protein